MAQIRSLILRITEQCNLGCAYCYATASGCTAPMMSPDLATHAVALCCPEGGSLSIQFTGGEPLLNLPVMEAVYAFGKATGRKLRLSVQTNGTLLTPENCLRLKNIGCAVGVSLDGLPQANRLRTFKNGVPAYNATIEGIRNLGQAGLRCNLTTVVTSANASFLGQLPDLALWLGNVSGVGLDLFRPLGRGQEQDLTPCREELTLGLKELILKTKKIQSAGIPFRLRELQRQQQRLSCGQCDSPYCYAQTDQSLCVDAAADCWRCSSLAGNADHFLGNLKDGLPAFPTDLPILPLPRQCSTCSMVTACGGGCPAGHLARNGQPDPMTCLITQVLFEGNHL